MILVLKLPDIKRRIEKRPKEYPGCTGETASGTSTFEIFVKDPVQRTDHSFEIEKPENCLRGFQVFDGIQATRAGLLLQ